MLCERLGRAEDALQALGEIADARRDALGPTATETANAQYMLADANLRAGRRAEAIRLHEEVLSSRRVNLPTGHLPTLQSLAGVAQLYLAEGRIEDARPLVSEALETDRDAEASNSPNLATMLIGFGRALAGRGEFGDGVQGAAVTGDRQDRARRVGNRGAQGLEGGGAPVCRAGRATGGQQALGQGSLATSQHGSPLR